MGQKQGRAVNVLVKEFEDMRTMDFTTWQSRNLSICNSKILVRYSSTLLKEISLGKDLQMIDGISLDLELILVINKSQKLAIRTFNLRDFKDLNSKFKREMRPVWQDSSLCQLCSLRFTVIRRKHHCRNCGKCVCSSCSKDKKLLEQLDYRSAQRVCIACSRKNTQETAPESLYPTFLIPEDSCVTFGKRSYFD